MKGAQVMVLGCLAILVGCIQAGSETVHGALVAVQRFDGGCTVKIAPVNGDASRTWDFRSHTESICKLAEDLLGKTVKLHTLTDENGNTEIDWVRADQ